MKLLKPSLTKEFSQYVPFKLSFTLTVIILVVSTVLLLLFMFVYHDFHLSERLCPNVVKADNLKIAVKPHVYFPEKHLTLPALEKKLAHRFLFSQRLAVPVSKKPATSLAQSVIGNGPTGVIQMHGTLQHVHPGMVKSFQFISDSHESTST